VLVRTNEPVRYSVNRGGDKSVVVELENTRIALANNERVLDTSYFDTAIAMITPMEGDTRTVRIEIKLKESVPYEAHQQGADLVIDFQRPTKR
jgi:colicin import membrane protein